MGAPAAKDRHLFFTTKIAIGINIHLLNVKTDILYAILVCSNRLQTSHLSSLIWTVILHYFHKSEQYCARETEGHQERLTSAVENCNGILKD